MSGDKRKLRRIFAFYAPQRYFLLLQFAILLGTLVFLFSILMSSVSSAMEAAQPIANSTEKLNVLFDTMVRTFFIKISILFAVVFFLNVLLGFFFLERLTGPLIRIQRALEEIGSGRIPDADVYLRKSDFPVDLAHALSGAIAYLRRKRAGL